MRTTSGEAPVVGGRLHYETAGSGPALVFVHGFGLDHRMWDPQWRVFPHTHRCVRYDCRGFGRSTLPGSDPYRHGDDLVSLLDHLEIAEAALVGLSMGAEVVLQLAVRHPERCTRLVLVDGFLSSHAFSPEWKGMVRPVIEAARQGDVPEARRRWLASPLFAAARERPGVASALRALVADYSGWHWQQRDPGLWDLPEDLGSLGRPTLVMIGDRDLADFQAIGRHFADAIPGARLVRLPTGHLPNLEEPARFDALLADFLAEPDRREK